MLRGFYIGRFQPYHSGHHAVVKQIADDIDEVVVGVGSADQSHTERNPFTAGERVMMITKSLRELDATTYVVPIEDLNRNAVWVSHVQSMSPTFDIAYSNNPLVVRLFEEAGVEVRQSPMFDRGELQGAEIRQRMTESGAWRELVPDGVVEVVEECNGVARLGHIAESDVPSGD
ncbi:nicotinamide-nucleotide adenylyltransferase [Haloplanus halobius]|uniref:nicotinamide-nucleotide adenylyltransferase n=1 Tax=Haloplanus halobius TaxID=2934938 RepID=UPI00200D4067|nr:nicotinamide-nucleotide adenylyltransferase [Haloplanus sp. XH21]